MDDSDADVCRVCRMEGSKHRPLFHPCHCSGSIRYVHQECLIEWLRVSKKDYCELCKHKVTFKPIYSADMPTRLPVSDLLSGLVRSLMRAIGCWIHYTAVACAWLGFVPLVTCRIYYSLFSGSVQSLLMIPYDLFTTDNFMRDVITGCFIVGCTMGIFVCLLYLREQFMQGAFQNFWDVGNQVGFDEQNENEDEIANEVAELARLLNDQLDENDIQEDNTNDELENGLNIEENNDNDDILEDEIANQEQNIEPDIAAIEVEANVNEIRMEPVNVDQPDDNQNDLFNEGENPEPAEQWNLEELTWERMLGLDGSFVFLEHVFWVVSLNTLFILLFAYFPHQMGKVFAKSIYMETKNLHFEGAINTIIGYCMFGLMFMASHVVSSLMNMEKMSQLAKLLYICIKAAIFMLFESFITPLLCGCWIDVCSLSLLNSTLADRMASYDTSPGTSLGFHWLFGMLFIFYFYTFFLFTKEVLRPGLIWFMANLNDPEFNPLKEMMYMPTMNYVKRFAIMLTLFGTIIVFIVWIPVKFIKMVHPDFLPYRVFAISDEPLNHVSLELVTLQVFLPTLLEQTHIKIFLKTVIRLWAESVGYILDLRGYLLGERIWRNFGEAIEDPEPGGFLRAPEQNQNGEDNAPQDANQEPGGEQEDGDIILEEAIQEQEQVVNDPIEDPVNDHVEDPVDDVDGPNDPNHDEDVMWLNSEIRTHHVYNKPSYFKFRVGLLLVSVAISLSILSTCMFYFPVRVGREVLGAIVGRDRKIHEMYTLFLGLFICWLPLLGITVVSRWAPMGRQILLKKLRKKFKIGIKILTAFVAVAGGIALLFGLLFDLVFLTPLRVPMHQTPITYVLVDWAFGAVHVKIAVAFTLLGPNWWLRDALENIYNQGARNFQLKNFLWVVVWPVASTLIIMLTIPYIIAFGLVPLIPVDESLVSRFQRRVYPAFFFGALGMFILHLQYLQFCRLIESIKNSKYLVGQRLVNYDPSIRRENKTATSTALRTEEENPEGQNL